MNINIWIISALIISTFILAIRILYFKNFLDSLENTNFLIFKSKLLYVSFAIMLFITLLICFFYKMDIYFIKLIDLMITLILLALLDIKYKIVPNKILIYLLISQLIISGLTLQFGNMILDIVIGTALLGIITFISFISKGKIGMGDAKLLAIMVLVVGFGFVARAIFYGLFIAFIASIILLIIKKASIKAELPFVPFITIGVFIAAVTNVI